MHTWGFLMGQFDFKDELQIAFTVSPLKMMAGVLWTTLDVWGVN